MSSLNNIIKSNKGYEIGHISHRKDGDYKKVGKGEWEKIGEEKSEKPTESKDKVKGNDLIKDYNFTSEEHKMLVIKDTAEKYPELKTLARQREPFYQKRLEAFKKLKDNPDNPKANADFVDATNAINEIDVDIDKIYKKIFSD